AVAEGAAVAINAALGYVGHDLAAIESARVAATASASGPVGQSTAKAHALAQAHGVDLAQVTPHGATIKERDVARFLAARSGDAGLIGDPRLVPAGKLSTHEVRVARDLREAAHAGLFTTLAYTLDLRGPERAIAAELSAGRTVSLLHVLLQAIAKFLPAYPRLASLLAGDAIYRYRDLDIAFAVRSPSGELHAPVVRGVDRMRLDEIARACAGLAKRAMRGKLDA